MNASVSRNQLACTIVLLVIVLAIISAGCSSPVRPQANDSPRQTTGSSSLYGNGTFNVNGTLRQVNGTLHISSVPAGADVYIDNEYWCPTDCALPYVIPPGHHTVVFRKTGYESVTYPVTVEKGGMEGISVTLESIQTVLPAASNSTQAHPGDLPQIKVNGYWTYPEGKNTSTGPMEGKYPTGPVPLIVHIEAVNVGNADARKVTASANVYNEGYIVSRTPVDLGPLAAGSQVSRVITVNCTIPGGYIDVNLDVLVENVTVTQ
jgi:hypothetical protein